MCGIVGYVGKKDCVNVLLDGLSSLEYRGYDSAGILTMQKNNNNTYNLNICKTKGRVNDLKISAKQFGISGCIGIGHTRWATHGEPSDINSHPHMDSTSSIGVVHNGIIENYLELKDTLINKGYAFASQTDTEVIPNLIKDNYTGNTLDATITATALLKGSYAIAIVSKENPDEMIVTKKDSPLIIGKGDNEYFVASDIPALLKHTNKVYILEDGEFAKIKLNEITFFNSNKMKLDKKYKEINWSLEAAEKCGYPDFMLKEIFEQPTAVRKTINDNLKNNKFLSELKIDDKFVKSINKIYIVACGTAMHAGLSGKNLIERYLKIPVEVDIASEFRYRHPIINENTLMITLSQSGETADTLAALRLAKSENAKTLAITNSIGSTISREADHVFYTQAGPEIAVASTKAYNTQLATIYMLMISFAEILNIDVTKLKQEIETMANKIEIILNQSEYIETIAKTMFKEKDAFFLGRGYDYPVSLEGSLKLKEISYIHSEAYAAGELKHGPIALIETGTYVICTITDNELLNKSLSNIQEIITRGAKVILITNKKIDSKYYDYLIEIPDCPSEFSSMLSIIPMQLLAYYISKLKNLDVDKPRNLAKSVTVE
ncbi:MAG: glutamine--fructose-6-phosphate transaminase (isomerizing) [Clostridia bacterium]|nr:glutamine--fructose-6-phosphate transaminase (isomerizing) [Clostridia bacterium]